jgi:hypothetical protein
MRYNDSNLLSLSGMDMPAPPPPHRQSRTGVDFKSLDDLEAFGTTGQRAYYKRRVRQDVIAILEDLQLARRAMGGSGLGGLTHEQQAYVDHLHELVEHIPHLLNASCARKPQWHKLCAQIPRENDALQGVLPLPPPR